MEASVEIRTSNTRDIARLSFSTFSNIINGKLTTTKATRHGINPATEQELSEVPVATEKDLDDAVHAAKIAFKSWSKTPLSERRAALEAFAVGLESYEAEFANLLTREQGKPILSARGEVRGGSAWIRAISKIDIPDEVVSEGDRKVITRNTPLGVVGAIVPWNYPLHIAVGKIAPAVVTGNTIIVKPSPFTPYCGLKMVELAQQFFPPGVIQVLSGDDNLGPWITAHPNIDKISFTGSTATGKKVMESASKTLKRITLELGGNDPAIICKDVDIAVVAPKIAQFAFLNSGQICLAIKRIYVHESIYTEFRAAIVAATKQMQVGDGFTDGVFLGPIQNKMQYDRVCGFFNDIEKQGQEIAVGGAVEHSQGYFIKPTIIDNPSETSRIVLEEPFGTAPFLPKQEELVQYIGFAANRHAGPIIPIMRWSTEADVINRANNTQMGLGASVWTNDMQQGDRIARQLEAGNVWVNSHLEVSPAFPFGGHKQSGIGLELGVAGLKSFCNTQTLFLKEP